jgi:hypothetical protein
MRRLVCIFNVVDWNLMQDDVRSAIPRTATRKKTNGFLRTSRCRSSSRAMLPKNLIGRLSRAGSLTTTMVSEAYLLRVLCVQEHIVGKAVRTVAMCVNQWKILFLSSDQRTTHSYIGAHANVRRCHHVQR